MSYIGVLDSVTSKGKRGFWAAALPPLLQIIKKIFF
jgi:hypothetical protein